MRVLNEDQRLLTDYLTASGMPLIERMLVVTDLWDQEATQEMFQRIAETGEKSTPILFCRVMERHGRNLGKHAHK